MIAFELKNLFPPLQPDCHLGIFIPVVRCPVSVLRQVNVEAFRVLCIIIVSRPKELDGVNIVNERVQLWEVEIVPDTEVHEDVFVRMKPFKRLVQKSKCFGGM